MQGMYYKRRTLIFHFRIIWAKRMLHIVEWNGTMLHSGMKWSCFIWKGVLWSTASPYEAILRIMKHACRRMKRSLRCMKRHCVPWSEALTGFMFFCLEIKVKKGHTTQHAGSVSIAGRSPRSGGQPYTTAGGARVRGRKMPRISGARRIDYFLPKVYFQGKKIGDTPKRTSGIRAKKWGSSFRSRPSTSPERVELSLDGEKINCINAVWRPSSSKK